MTIKINIEINIPEEAIGETEWYIDRVLKGTGFMRRPPEKIYQGTGNFEPVGDAVYGGTIVVGTGGASGGPGVVEGRGGGGASEGMIVTGYGGAGGMIDPAKTVVTPAPTRERGQPSPGKARRTKAEIAEDDAAQERDNEIADRKAGDAFIVGRGEGAKYGISTGGERINPEDAADEAREVEPGLTLDTVRRAMGALAEKIGMEKAIELQPTLIGKPIADLEPDEIPEVLIRLRNAADVADAPAAASAFDDATPEPEKPVATKQDVVNAMLRYAKKFDGTQDPAKAVIAGVDCGKVFQMATGDDAINKLSLLPEAFYAKAIEGIDKALEINHFGRTAK